MYLVEWSFDAVTYCRAEVRDQGMYSNCVHCNIAQYPACSLDLTKHHLAAQNTWLSTAAGEYGELLLSKAEAPLQSGEEPLSVSSQELVQLLETVLSHPTIKPVGREYALTALMKLSTRLPDYSQHIQVTAHMH